MSTELQKALVANDAAKVKSELSKGADPNEEYTKAPISSERSTSRAGTTFASVNLYTTPLIAAVELKNLDMAKMLIDAGANTCKCPRNGQTPLHHAICTENIPMIKLLLENGANFNLPNDFITAIEKQNFKLIQELIDLGADVNRPNSSPELPVMCAIRLRNCEILKLLSQSGVDLNVTDSGGDTPLIKATRMMNFPMVKCLIENGVDLNQKSEDKTALSISLANDDFRTFQLLIESGADPKLANQQIGEKIKTNSFLAAYMLKGQNTNSKKSQKKQISGHEAASNYNRSNE